MKEQAVIGVENNFVPSARHESNREKDITFMQPLFSKLFFKLALTMTLTAALSCQKRDDSHGISAATDTLLFDTESMGAPVKILRCEAILSKQRVQIEVHLPMTTHQSMDQLISWELVTAQGNRSIPVTVNVDLPAGYAALIYEPIHSRELFQRTGLRGDIESEYMLHLTLPEDGREKKLALKLAAADGIYQESLKIFGLASGTTPYSLALNDQFVDQQKEHLQKTLVSGPAPPESTIHTTEIEILIRGLWLKVQSHHQRDTFYADVRIVNQFQSEINLDLSAIMLNDGDSVVRHNLGGDQKLKIPNGRRARINLKFQCPVAANTYKLDLSALTFPLKGKQLPVFLSPVVLRKTTLFPPPSVLSPARGK